MFFKRWKRLCIFFKSLFYKEFRAQYFSDPKKSNHVYNTGASQKARLVSPVENALCRGLGVEGRSGGRFQAGVQDG